ncbi:hypothetical protein N7533_000292 [Penicillium manginii]|uniref:uncharacterized protein n=1 Tax=Penicillium manginii TaxID=203109 RepID=UPI002547C3EC|nr:uncharacterized protein N7533_000292 [Penicillium manginii]KAJ5767709.1 hypothetical protein N7533_000292 [Penicillium manginii]
MVTNGNAARDGNHHHNVGLGASSLEEESGLMADCASERSFGNQDPAAHRKDEAPPSDQENIPQEPGLGGF